jgi:outer membrane receptor protein involved in Fe transport
MGVRAKLLYMVGIFVLSTPAGAQDPKAAGTYALDIPAEPLADALNDLAQQSGLEILFSSQVVERLRSPALKGALSAEEALHRLLANTHLRYRFVNPHTITIAEEAGSVSGTPTSGEKPPAPAPGGPSEHTEVPAAHRPGLVARLLSLFAVCGAALDPGAACAQSSVAPAADLGSTLQEVIVTARKRDESLAEVPESITVFTSATLANYDIQSFNDYATKVPNISFTYGSGPEGISEARTVAIRGITGQNFVGTSGATGFYIDDTPVPSSLDPRVLDIADIEVLKGPQGTLFGESSLGGNVRLITKKPNLTADTIGYMAQAGLTSGGGSADGGGSVIGNVVLSPDKLALRIVLFANHDAGYLTRTFPDPTSPAVTDPFLSVPRTSVGNQGAVMSYGGSIAALLNVTDQFEVRLRMMFQNTEDHGFPATFAPLPSFTPDYTLNRAFDVQPRASDVWALPSLDLKYTGQGWSLVSSSSFFYRHTRDIEDSTYGTQQILNGYYGVTNLPAQPFLWDGERFHDQVTEEMRVSFDPVHDLSGTAGLFYARTHSKQYIPPTYAQGLVAATVNNAVVGPWPNDLLWTDSLPILQQDYSLFGELYYKFFERFNLTLGARQYWLKQEANYTADGFQNFGLTPDVPIDNRQKGVSPKVALSYQATGDVMIYTNASKGFRAGGAQTFAPFCAEPNLPINDLTQLKSDTLWSYEIGTKIQVPNPGLLISAAAFRINWKNLQQQVALPCGAYYTINGDSATINGGEIEIAGHLTRSLQIRFGAGYERTDIAHPGALEIVGVTAGSRILGVPAWTASLGAVYTQPITNGLDGVVSADYSYTGDSVSLLNSGGGAFATRPSYSLVNLRFAVVHDDTQVSLNVRNATNAKPNLGDIGYNGYAQYDSQGVVLPMVATLPPLTVMLQYQKNF